MAVPLQEPNVHQTVAQGFLSHLLALRTILGVQGKAGLPHWSSTEELCRAAGNAAVLAKELGYDPNPIYKLVMLNDLSRLDEVITLADRIRTSVQDEVPAPSLHHETPQTPIRNNGDFHTAQWFSTETKIPSSRLRHAAGRRRKTKRVRAQDIDGVICYSVDDARLWWPQDMPNS